jgi:hypothetical protein
MLRLETYHKIVLGIFSEQLTLEDVEHFSATVEKFTRNNDELYLILIPMNISGFPTKLPEIIKAAKAMQTTTARVTRLYGVKYSPLMSFVGNVTTQILHLKNNTIEANTLDDLFARIEAESAIFPGLRESLDRHGEKLKTAVAR